MITVTIWHNVAHDAEGRHIASWRATSPATLWSASSPTGLTPPGGRRRRSPRRRSRSATTIPSTPPARTWPAVTTPASCGRCLPRKESVLPQVLLQHLGSHVVRGAVHSAS